MDILFDNNGQTTQIRDNRDLMKAMGMAETGRPIIMTDETGALVGVGRSGAELTRSLPLLKAMRESQPLVKKPVLIKKHQPMMKSMRSRGATGFDGLLSELANIRRSLA